MKILIIALIIIFSSYLFGQLQGQAKIDSLLKELPKAKADTNHVNLLNNLSFAYCFINPDKGFKYSEGGLKLAKKIDWKWGYAKSYNLLGLNSWVKSDYSKALEYYRKGIKINEGIGNKSGMENNYANMGLVYFSQSDYQKALEYYGKSLKINEELGDRSGIAYSYGNMGNVYQYQSNYPKALEYYGKSLKINEELGDKKGIANSYGNMGLVYQFQSNYPKALEYYGKSLKINEELGDKNGVAIDLANMGLVYQYQSNYLKAIEYSGKALEINKELGNKNGVATNLVNLGGIYQNQSDYLNALEYFGKSLEMYEELGNKSGEATTLVNMGGLYLKLSNDSVSINPSELNQYLSLNKSINLNNSIEYSLQAIEIFEEIGELDFRSIALKNLADAYRQKGEMTKAFEALEQHYKLKDSVYSEENNDKIAALEKAREDDLNRLQIEKQKVQLAAQESEKLFIIYSGIGIIAFVIAILIIIANQRKKSDKLLYNVLPITIAKRLKKKEHPISDHFDQASIIFIDIVGFTAMSKDSNPRDIVQALNKVFTHYDSIARKHGLEKIKTIGDSYMAAAGIPVIQKDNTLRAARMAIEVRDYMVDYYTDHGYKLDVRIGVDCGPVVAGVIGETKFIYDMWSDAVNTASRMESTGQSGTVQISERFKEAVSEYDEFKFTARGEMEIKGKGKMNTYFLES